MFSCYYAGWGRWHLLLASEQALELRLLLRLQLVIAPLTQVECVISQLCGEDRANYRVRIAPVTLPVMVHLVKIARGHCARAAFGATYSSSGEPIATLHIFPLSASGDLE